MQQPLILIKGAGDLATGAAHRLATCGFAVAMLEIPQPTVIRRTVAFAEAVYKGKFTVEGITAILAKSPAEIKNLSQEGKIAVLVDPGWMALKVLRPAVVLDAILAKKNLGTSLGDAPIVIGMGPGFTAGTDVHAVVETKRGHDLGKVIYSGSAIPNTGIPGNIGGYSSERLLKSPAGGIFLGKRKIGDMVEVGDIIATVGNTHVRAAISGVIRGLLHDGLQIPKNFKIGDIDPRGESANCFTISDKARSVAGGVLEAVLYFMTRGEWQWMQNSGQPLRKRVHRKNLQLSLP